MTVDLVCGLLVDEDSKIVASVGGEWLRFCSVTMALNALFFNPPHVLCQYDAHAIDDARGARGR